jgi:hypothetical protein
MPQTTNSDPAGRPPALSGAASNHSDTVVLTNLGEPAERSDRAPSNERPTGSLPTTPPIPDPESPRLAFLGGRYDILGEAGHGSMGNVYKARDRETGEIVALKLLKPEIASDQTMIERFKNELLFARKITHKNVCRMYDFNRIDRIAYTSMEFVAGESLRSVLNRFGGLPVRKAVGVALQICSGLKEAHAQGIVHRDLKPENVMIDAQGNVKIMDFGIARSMEAATRLTGSMVGTPAYMAPEQVAGKPVDYRTDIYSLGLMLYEMFTGTQAFQADTPVVAALKQLRETPPPPHDIDPTIPVAIERAILKCLEKDPAKRFQSIADLEKVLAAPGVTGSWPGLATGPAVLSLPTPAQTAKQVAPSSLPSAAMAPERRRTSPVLWVLLGAFIVFAGLAAAHWAKFAEEAKLIPPPASLPAPKPPAFALKTPDLASPAPAAGAATANGAAKIQAKTNPGTKKPLTVASSVGPSKPAAAPSDAHKPANAVAFPAVELPGKKSARQVELERAPSDVESRANKAFGAFGQAKSSGNDAGATKYLWVGRFERQERADDAVQRISNLGLPVVSVPRRSWQGKFWVVIAGPFPAKRVPDVIQWLKTQGFREVREFALPDGMRPRGMPSK